MVAFLGGAFESGHIAYLSSFECPPGNPTTCSSIELSFADFSPSLGGTLAQRSLAKYRVARLHNSGKI